MRSLSSIMGQAQSKGSLSLMDTQGYPYTVAKMLCFNMEIHGSP